GPAAVDAPGTKVLWLRAVTVLDAVVNLALVTVGELARNAANEQAAVQFQRVADRLHLENKISKLFFRFENAPIGTRHMNLALISDRERALALRMVLPAGEVLAVEQRRQTNRLELDVFELELAFV